MSNRSGPKNESDNARTAVIIREGTSEPRRLPLFTSLRGRLLLLVLVGAIPAIGLIFYDTFEARKNQADEARPGGRLGDTQAVRYLSVRRRIATGRYEAADPSQRGALRRRRFFRSSRHLSARSKALFCAAP